MSLSRKLYKLHNKVLRKKGEAPNDEEKLVDELYENLLKLWEPGWMAKVSLSHLTPVSRAVACTHME